MRLHNFSAGPAALPESILKEAQEALWDFEGRGVSIIEMSHRSQVFMDLLAETEADLRSLLGISADYAVLFLSGPAREQFSAIPLNLFGNNLHADYLDTGIWSRMAFEEGMRYGQMQIVASAKDSDYLGIPKQNTWKRDKTAAYFYYTANETVNGVEFSEIPDSQGVALITDMTSCLLSRPLAVDRFGLIFAGVQKNISTSGLTIVIVRKDLLGRAHPLTPTCLNYQVIAEQKSLYYTNNCFSTYLAHLNFKWLMQMGGLAAMEKLNRKKAQTLYDYIDSEPFYVNRIEKASRSIMNVPFLLKEASLTPLFLQTAEAMGFIGLQGHRFVGGLRASLYNAVTQDSVDALVDFMQDFVKRRG